MGSDAKDVDGRRWLDLHAREEGFEESGSGVPSDDMPAGKLDGVGGGAGRGGHETCVNDGGGGGEAEGGGEEDVGDGGHGVVLTELGIYR